MTRRQDLTAWNRRLVYMALRTVIYSVDPLNTNMSKTLCKGLWVI